MTSAHFILGLPLEESSVLRKQTQCPGLQLYCVYIGKVDFRSYQIYHVGGVT